ncbi:uncharacterized protein BDV14DRAFT_173352 [Aspergillus stella-maris]|uniref:uncharacterized protein n=1 Tax=Aspergillus stella-maris TaxID=1810926 RepID=UPI003CCD4E84
MKNFRTAEIIFTCRKHHCCGLSQATYVDLGEVVGQTAPLGHSIAGWPWTNRKAESCYSRGVVLYRVITPPSHQPAHHCVDAQHFSPRIHRRAMASEDEQNKKKSLPLDREIGGAEWSRTKETDAGLEKPVASWCCSVDRICVGSGAYYPSMPNEACNQPRV